MTKDQRHCVACGVALEDGWPFEHCGRVGACHLQNERPVARTKDLKLHPSDIKIVEERARKLIEDDQSRYDRVMAEIDKDEQDCRSRLRDIRMRRAVVQKAGHLK